LQFARVLIVDYNYNSSKVNNAQFDDVSNATDICVNLTPLSQMGTETFARRMTGGESLNDDQKKQIREQQEVRVSAAVCLFVLDG